MPRNAAVAIENNFTKGLITEATGLNFPENACTETYDCVFDERGKVSRRLGINYEDGAVYNDIGTDIAHNMADAFVWENVAGRGDLTFVVVQIGSDLHFFSTSADGALSANLAFSIDLTDFHVAGAPAIEERHCSFASGNGALFVTHPYCETFYVTYAPSTQDHTETTITIEIRDFDGVEDTEEVDERPSTLTTAHKYNLYNQGWYITATCGGGFTDSSGDGDHNVLEWWDTNRSDYPSNVDIWWTMKNANELFVPKHANRFSFKGNTRAPQGHFILSAFYQDRTDASGIPGLAVVSSGFARPSVCAFHANRLFVGGVAADKFSNKLYFTQIIKDDNQYGKCYQREDPTSEDVSDLLQTDGGVISVLEAGAIAHLFSVENFLVVFASNGIWSISGSEGKAFAANDYSVDKISNIAVSFTRSFVNVNGYPVWWTNDGIYSLIFDPISGRLQVKSLTDRTIKTFFNDIPVSSKAHCIGAYNNLTKVVQWTYRSDDGDDDLEYHQHDRVLAFNTLTEAFYPWRISMISATLGPWVGGVFCTKGLTTESESENVTDENGDLVTDGGNAVTATVNHTQYLNASFRYVVIVKQGSNYKLTFAQEYDSSYEDWGSADYQSYALSGFKVHGQALVKFQTNYLQIYMDTETNSSCFLEAWWDYASDQDSGRVSNQQQIYNHNSNFSLSKRRLKIRGHGKALQFKLFSESGKPFTIVGWAGFETGNTQP